VDYQIAKGPRIVVEAVTEVPDCTTMRAWSPYYSTPTARYVDEKRLEDGVHLQDLCSIYCHEHDIYVNRLAKIAAIDRADPQPNRMRGSRVIPVVRILQDPHPQK
jgi:hypothetical protein